MHYDIKNAARFGNETYIFDIIQYYIIQIGT